MCPFQARRLMGCFPAIRPPVITTARPDAWVPGLAVPLITACFLAIGHAEAGHELPYYPSFYPHEIRIEAVAPASAGARLQKNSLHAYIGGDPFGGREPPANVGYAESLGSYLVVTFNTASKVMRDRETRCAASRDILHSLAGAQEAFIFHPYPVTPYHPDYLHHFDLAESVKKESRTPSAGDQGSGGRTGRVRARGNLAEALARSRWRAAERDWDATLEEVDVGGLVASRTVSLNGWLGPPWLKEGWFHAYLLLAEMIPDRTQRTPVDSLYQRLASGTYATEEERLNLERTFVSLLTRGCERVVVGYTVRRTYFNSDFSEGVENIAQDAHTGFLSPIFLRTVKLKDFPWNGWLRLGIEAKPLAAWNPIGGFTDPVGRLVWFAVGDPALFPAPHNGSWLPNRATAVVTGSPAGAMEIPHDALIPEAGTGVFQRVGQGKTAKAKVVYTVPMSRFHDGTRMTPADVLYPFLFAYRWGVRHGQDGNAYDPFVHEATALLRERLAGLRVLRTEREVKDLGEVKLVWEVPTIEVYLHSTSFDPQHVAAIAPPWSSLPWHLIVLMEESVKRGLAAFSLEEAKRRGVEWLDLVRGKDVRARLASLADELERGAYIPDSLKGLVTVGEAKQRWAALKQFSLKHGHFLVTNGPYRLETWGGDSVVVQVFRDLSYPLGVGSFDRHALRPRAFVSKVEERRNSLRISAEIEKPVRVQRTYTTVREPLTSASEVGAYRVEPVSRYVAVSLDGTVRTAGTAPIADDGTFALDLQGLTPGQYTILIAIYPNGNQVNPEVKTIPYRVER